MNLSAVITPDVLYEIDPENPQVKRTHVLKDIAKYLNEIDEPGSPPSSKLINITGATGIGKTGLITQIFFLLSEYFVTLWFHFSTTPPHPSNSEHTPLSEVIARLKQYVSVLGDIIEPVQTFDGPIDAAKVSLFYTDRNIDQYGKGRPLLLLIDEFDDIAYWHWFQEQCVKPLFQHPPALIICASQSSAGWDFWELREREEPRASRVFDEDELQRFLDSHGYGPIHAAAQQLTAGYPLKLQVLLNWLKNEGRPVEGAEPDLAALEAESQELTSFARQVLPLIGVLRRLEPDVAVTVLDRMLPGWNGDRQGRRLIADLLGALTRQNIFEPYVRGRPLRLPRSQRVAYEQALRAREPERYTLLLTLLRQIYQERYSARPLTEAALLYEWMLVTAKLLELAGPEGQADARARWSAALKALVERGRDVGSKLAVDFYRDGELVAYLRERDLLREVEALLADRLEEGTGGGSPQLLNISEEELFRQQLLREFSRRTPINQLEQYLPRGGFDRLLQTLASLPAPFHTDEVRNALSDREGRKLSAATTLRMITLLLSSGFVRQISGSRTFELTDLARSLVALPSAQA